MTCKTLIEQETLPGLNLTNYHSVFQHDGWVGVLTVYAMMVNLTIAIVNLTLNRDSAVGSKTPSLDLQTQLSVTSGTRGHFIPLGSADASETRSRQGSKATEMFMIRSKTRERN